MLHLLLAAALAVQEPQQPTPPPPRDTTQGALRVYLDCGLCDLDFLRTEISFVDWVRDRHDAQLYVMVSTQGTGAGGTEYTLTFIGQEKPKESQHARPIPHKRPEHLLAPAGRRSH